MSTTKICTKRYKTFLSIPFRHLCHDNNVFYTTLRSFLLPADAVLPRNGKILVFVGFIFVATRFCSDVTMLRSCKKANVLFLFLSSHFFLVLFLFKVNVKWCFTSCSSPKKNKTKRNSKEKIKRKKRYCICYARKKATTDFDVYRTCIDEYALSDSSKCTDFFLKVFRHVCNIQYCLGIWHGDCELGRNTST